MYTLFRPKIARDGGMTEWTEWSCNSKCKSSRARNCTNPLPLFGGTNCTEEGYEELEPFCYGNDCCPGRKLASSIQNDWIIPFPDSSDYIGCYAKNDLGLTLHETRRQYTMTNCFCIGYCRSLNYSLAGLFL